MATKAELERQVRELRHALLALVYEKDGHWHIAIKSDWDVTDEVAKALRLSANT